jgi:hypothetical protein
LSASFITSGPMPSPGSTATFRAAFELRERLSMVVISPLRTNPDRCARSICVEAAAVMSIHFDVGQLVEWEHTLVGQRSYRRAFCIFLCDIQDAGRPCALGFRFVIPRDRRHSNCTDIESHVLINI